MAGSSVLGRALREEDVRTGYLFHGEDLFLAREFVEDLKAVVAPAGTEAPHVEKFDPAASSWYEVLDVARTMPFFFSPWRVLLVETDEEGLTEAEAAGLRDYFSGPTARTTIVVLFEGKLHKTKGLAKAFAALPPSAVTVREVKALKGSDLLAWADERLAALGKRWSSEAAERLLEVTGNDLGRLDREIDKLATYLGERKMAEAADVTALTEGGRDFAEWELSAALESGDFDKAVIVLNSQFAEGTAPELVLYKVMSFYRDILLAKAWLRERSMDRKEIFRALKPQISERFGSFYQTKFREFFALVERMTMSDLRRSLTELAKIDLRIKTTDVAPRTLFEAFFAEAGSKTRKAGPTWPGRA